MLTVVIQAGGESRRMGRDKALLPFLGKPLIERVMGRVSTLADELLVTTNRPEAYAFLGVPLFSDLIPDRGALGGLYTALSIASQPLVAVVACDMPFASAELLAWERDQMLEGGYAAAIPVTPSGSEPFHAVYRRETCLPAILSAIQAHQWRVDSWYSQVEIRFLLMSEMKLFDLHRLAFRNINTPEDLAQAEQIALGLTDQYRG
jgi:molybdopterin-guanine dinucleotide biosynthesis protein A